MRRAQLSLGPPSMLAATRMVRGSLVLPFVATAVAIYASAALSWDGAAQLFTLLDLQRTSLPFTRATVALFEYPALLLSRYSSDVRVLTAAYGLGYAVLPAACALASWQIVRRTHPRLVVWPLLWLGVGAVPGQFFFVGESLMAAHVTFPLLLAVVTGLSLARGVFCLVTALFLFGLHSAAGPLLLLVAAAAAACAMQDASRRRGLVTASALFFFAGGARIGVSLYDPYEASQTVQDVSGTLEALRLPWFAAVAGAVSTLSLLSLHVKPGLRRGALGVLGAAYAVFAFELLIYAADPRAWQDAMNYRFVAPFAAAPFLVGAAVVAIATPRAHCYLSPPDGLIALSSTTLFAAVLSVQSMSWLDLRGSLERALGRAGGGCISMSALPQCRNTALRWWSTPSYALLVQGRAPRALLLPPGECGKRGPSRVIPVTPWYPRPRDAGWFDLSQAGSR